VKLHIIGSMLLNWLNNINNNREKYTMDNKHKHKNKKIISTLETQLAVINMGITDNSLQ